MQVLSAHPTSRGSYDFLWRHLPVRSWHDGVHDWKHVFAKFGATLFPAYSAFNLSYAMIYRPGSGIMASYTNTQTGEVHPQFYQALAIYIWAWFILTVLFCVAAIRSSWVLFMDLVALSISFLLLASGNMVQSSPLLTAGYSFGLVVAFLSYWAGVAGLWAGDTTPIDLPTFKMYKDC